MALAGRFMLGLLVFKLLATTFTLGAGNSGGVFAPGLFMGAMLGGLIGRIGNEIDPTIFADPGAYALVGMAALFAGAARSPITAIIIVLEMSNDYKIILPLLMAVMVSTIVSDFLHPDSIYTKKLSLRGIHLNVEEDIDVLQGVTVKDIMQTNYTTVHPEMLLTELMPRFTLTHHHGFPIVDDHGYLQGIITLTDVERSRRSDDGEHKQVIEVGTVNRIIKVFPDEPVYVALRQLNVYDIGRLPVVSRTDEKTFIGMVQRIDILKAYNLGIARRATEQHRTKYYKLRDMDRHDFLEIEVDASAPMVGRTLMEFPCSDTCLVVAVHRGDQTLMAHGTTKILPGDRVTAYVLSGEKTDVLAQFLGPVSPDKFEDALN